MSDTQAESGGSGVPVDPSHREKLVRSLVDQGLVGVYMIQHGLFSYVNEKFAELFGYSRDEIEGRLGPVDLTADEDRETVLGHIQRRLRGVEDSVRYEFSGKRKDGSSIRIEVHGTRIEQGGEPAIAGVLIDISEQRALREQLRHAQRVEGLGELTGAIAHDFNNYLTAILAPIELAIQDLGEDDPARQELLHARATAERAAGLTRQLLSFGRKRVHSPRPVYVNQVLENLASMLDRLTGAPIQVVFDLTPGLPAVMADPSHLQQVVVNLVVNARDAMPEGGRVVVQTGVQRRGAVERPLHGEASSRDPEAMPRWQDASGESDHEEKSEFLVSVTVRDEGQGMDRETLQHVFDPYFTTKERGTGLGLSTVFGIVKQHGGEVRANSAPGEGTAFTILLPATSRRPDVGNAGKEPSGAGHRESQETQPTKRTILVVEDEAAVRRVTTAALQRFGYTVLDAEDGQQALELIETHVDDLDLLITDMGLPRMTGPDVARAVEERRPDVPALFMSGHASDDLVGELDDREHVRFLEKPFMVDELLDAVERALRASTREIEPPDLGVG